MVAAAVLSLGTVMIQGALLRSVDLLARTSNTLTARQWMSEKLWETKEKLFYSEEDVSSESGSFTESGRVYHWSLEVRPVSTDKLYSIRLAVSWQQGKEAPLEVVTQVYAAQ